MDIHKDVSPAFVHGAILVGITSEQVIMHDFPVFKGVQFKAGPNNMGTIYIGREGVTASSGFPLQANEGLFLPIEDISSVYAIASETDQALAWVAV